jgi:hypothetical protein
MFGCIFIFEVIPERAVMNAPLSLKRFFGLERLSTLSDALVGFLNLIRHMVRLRFDSWQRERIFLLASVSRPAMRPTQPPVQWVPGVLSLGLKRGRGVTLTTHAHLVPRSRMGKSYTSSSPSAFMPCSMTDLASY